MRHDDERDDRRSGEVDPDLERQSGPDLSPDSRPEVVSGGFTVSDDAAELAIGRVPGEDPSGDYGTGGGDVGIGGDVSPYGGMNRLDARPDEIEAQRHHDTPDYVKQGDTSERDEDLSLASDDLRQQGEDEAWPEADVARDGDPFVPFDDPDAPMMSIRDEDELEEGAA